MESPVCTPIGSKFSMEQTMMQLSLWSRTTSISNSFQPITDSSINTSLVGEASRPRAAHGERGPDDYGIAVLGGDCDRLLETARDLRFRTFQADLAHRIPEQLPVFCHVDGGARGGDELHAVQS